MQMFPHAVVNTGNEKSALTPRLPSFWVVWQKLYCLLHLLPFAVSVSQVAVAPQHPPPPAVNADLSVLRTSSNLQQSIFLIIGLCRQDVDTAMTKLKNLYQAKCSTQTFRKEDLAEFTQEDINNLKLLVEILGVRVEENQSDQGSWTVSGLKEGVDQIMKSIHN